MNVKDFFNSLDKNELIKFYLKYDEHTHGSDENGELYQYFTDLCNYKDLKPNTDKAIIWAVGELGTHLLHSFLIKDKDLNKKSLPKITYAYEFCDVGEILNFDVSKACIYKYGEFEYASSILYELTWFGYSLNEVQEKVFEETNLINKALEDIESGNCKPICAEHLLRNWNWVDERLSFEIEFDKKMNLLDCKVYKEQMKQLLELERMYRGINI